MKVLLTGGTSGLGYALTRKIILDSNIELYISYNKSIDKASELSEHPNCTTLQCDFNNPDSVTTLCESIMRIKPDILINNAHNGFEKNHFHKIDYLHFESKFKSNILSTLRITQAFVQQRKTNKLTGKIITVLSSVLINKPPAGWSEYAASKAYLHSMVKSWASEYLKNGITSNAISPEFMHTNMHKEEDERIIEQMTKNHPNKRLLTVDEVTDSIIFLLHSNQYINGINLVLNSGSNIA